MKSKSFKLTVSFLIAWFIQAFFLMFSRGNYLTPGGTKFFVGCGIGIALIGAFILIWEECRKLILHKQITTSINKTFRVIQRELPYEIYDTKWLEWNKATLVAYLEYIRCKSISINLNRLIEIDLNMLGKLKEV